MTVRTKVMACGLLAVTLATNVACGGDDDGSGGGTAGSSCTDFSGVTGSPSFENDVMPIFSLSCALSPSCHQTPTGKEDLVLGQAMTDGPPDQMLIDDVHALVVGAASTESSLPRVEAGNPPGSWLLLKMACDQDELTELESSCTKPDCEPMPPPGGGLDAERIDIVAAWIASGAPNN